MLYDRTCPECGKVFKPAYGSQVCCSAQCQKRRAKRQQREWEREHGNMRPSRSKLSPHQRMLANLRRRDALAPKPKTEIICRNGIIIERRGNVPAGCHAVGIIRHNT